MGRAQRDPALALRARGERDSRWSRSVLDGLSVAVLLQRMAKVEAP